MPKPTSGGDSKVPKGMGKMKSEKSKRKFPTINIKAPSLVIGEDM